MFFPLSLFQLGCCPRAFLSDQEDNTRQKQSLEGLNAFRKQKSLLFIDLTPLTFLYHVSREKHFSLYLFYVVLSLYIYVCYSIEQKLSC